ncbi:hypothetical protein GP475_02380 [Corynebacterium poyangense]|uniref:Uncharacterized protein n=1 Tax=Corynebacterium poyangense TaxID=2684405 RepID=A0A7H0SM35_9CORY|nr:hypothetical protein [Corynebacterium poyangense]QNQ89610.1 hypothetical protein GP475_02380 [Corynebacterium poyangense]
MKFLRAEIIRSWLSFRMATPLIVFLSAAQAWSINSGIQAHGGVGGLTTLHLYQAGIILPLGLITPVITEYSEYRQRYGGLLWRPEHRWSVQMSRLAVVLGYISIGHLFAPLPLVGFSWKFFLLETVIFLGAYGVGLLLWSLSGKVSMVIAPVLGIIWDILSVYRAESPNWFLNPLCWAMRASLKVFGVHANSVPAEPEDLVGIDPVLPAVLHLIVGVVCWCVGVSLIRHRVRTKGHDRLIRDVRVGNQVRTSQWRALAIALPWKGWAVLSVMMITLLLIMRMRYGAETASGFYSLICLPLGTTIAGITAWHAHQDAWRGLLFRPGHRTLFRTLLLLVYVPLLVVFSLGGMFIGMNSPLPYQVMVMPGIVAMILVVVAFSAVISEGLAIAGSFLIFIWSLMAGASVLAESGWWWISAPWAWDWVVHEHPEYWLIIVAITWFVALIVGAISNRRMSAKPR